MYEKVVTACPVVRSDPAALAMLQDPELFMGLTNPDNLNKYNLPQTVSFHFKLIYFFTIPVSRAGRKGYQVLVM